MKEPRTLRDFGFTDCQPMEEDINKGKFEHADTVHFGDGKWQCPYCGAHPDGEGKPWVNGSIDYIMLPVFVECIKEGLKKQEEEARKKKLQEEKNGTN